MRGFGSDNHSGAHPRYLLSIERANQGHVPSYGTDPISIEAQKLIKRLFGDQAEAHFVFNGTAANVLALSPFVETYHSILASEHSHLINDECGAPEKHLGCKIISVSSEDAKLTPESLQKHLIRRGDQHYSQVRGISITQPTELGTVYSLNEIRAITDFAKKENLFVHMDGARFVNAAAALNCTFKQMTTELGIDVLSLGGTKNGLLFGEAVVFLNDKTPKEFKFIRKQFMQLPSKTRFIASQFMEFLGTDLWRENALHANAMAKKLADGLQRSPFAEVTQKTEANAVFACFRRDLLKSLREKYFFYVWNEKTFECRLMTSWDTQPDDVDGFLALLERLGSRIEGAQS